MPKLFDTYWYREEPVIARAALYNLRDGDVRRGGRISKGHIVQGQCGFHVAEVEVVGFSGTTQPFQANRKCLWQKAQIPCMALAGLPAGPVPRSSAGGLRHKHCVVAELTSPDLLAKAQEMGLPVIEAEGRQLVNLEVASIPGQPAYRCAQLM